MTTNTDAPRLVRKRTRKTPCSNVKAAVRAGAHWAYCRCCGEWEMTPGGWPRKIGE